MKYFVLKNAYTEPSVEKGVPFRNRVCVCVLPIVSNGALTFDGKLDCKRCGDEWNTAKGSRATVIHEYDGKPAVHLSRRDYRRLIKRLNDRCPCGSGKKYKDCCFVEGGGHDG